MIIFNKIKHIYYLPTIIGYEYARNETSQRLSEVRQSPENLVTRTKLVLGKPNIQRFFIQNVAIFLRMIYILLDIAGYNNYRVSISVHILIFYNDLFKYIFAYLLQHNAEQYRYIYIYVCAKSHKRIFHKIEMFFYDMFY